MKQIALTNEAYTKHTIIQENGEEFILELRYLSSQRSWVINVFKNDFELRNYKLVLGANILRRWKNLINFGMLVYSMDKVDPFHINDFITNRVQMYILTQTEVVGVEQEIYES